MIKVKKWQSTQNDKYAEVSYKFMYLRVLLICYAHLNLHLLSASSSLAVSRSIYYGERFFVLSDPNEDLYELCCTSVTGLMEHTSIYLQNTLIRFFGSSTIIVIR